MNLAVATFPLSFLVSNCSALQGLDQQVGHRGVGQGEGEGGEQLGGGGGGQDRQGKGRGGLGNIWPAHADTCLD